ncbi:MAG: condensation domain-containing protein, partial [Acutalibacteraceae bacterium]|nr:condensation domain-containing protein [Acutalibacteraceae bacterium]
KEIDGIKDAAVIARADKNGDKAIFAYFTSDSEMDISEIRDILGETLPSYMIPSYMMQIEVIPVTKNGKLDKRALPEIEIKTQKEFLAPTSQIEIEVCNVFSNILLLDNISLNDSFFELGGDSLKAIRIISKLKDIGYIISVQEFMTQSSIKAVIEKLKISENATTYQQGEVVGVVKETTALTYLEKKFGENINALSEFIIIDVDNIDNDNIKKILYAIVVKNDMLRAVFRNGSLQILSVAESKLFDFYEFDIAGIADKDEYIKNECANIQSDFDIENGPIVKTAVFDDNNSKKLAIAVHKMVVDTHSWKIITDDFKLASEQLANNEEIKLTEKTASFIQWSELCEAYTSSDKFIINRKYWDKTLENLSEYRAQTVEDNVQIQNVNSIAEIFEQSEIKAVEDANSTYNTSVFDLLISAFALSLDKEFAKNNNVIIVENSERGEIHNEVSFQNTVGCFANYYPLIITSCDELENTIISNKEAINTIPNNGMEYGMIASDFDVEELSEFKFRYYQGNRIFNSADKLTKGISINCWKSENEFGFEISYNSSKYSKKTIMNLSEYFKESLKKITDLCLNKNDTVYTASDFDSSLDMDDFGDILGIIQGRGI